MEQETIGAIVGYTVLGIIHIYLIVEIIKCELKTRKQEKNNG